MIAKKLRRLKETKTEIADAMKSKGIPVKDSTTFREYADLIRKIDTNAEDYDPNNDGSDDPSGGGGSNGGGSGGSGGTGGGSTGAHYKFVTGQSKHDGKWANGTYFPNGTYEPINSSGTSKPSDVDKNQSDAVTNLNFQIDDTTDKKEEIQGFINKLKGDVSKLKAADWKGIVEAAGFSYDKNTDYSSQTTALISALTNQNKDLDTDITNWTSQIEGMTDMSQITGGDTITPGAAHTIYAYTRFWVQVDEEEGSEYTVNFYNGSSLLQSVTVESGESAIYEGSTPVNEDRPDAIFSGWNPSPNNVRRNMNCVAKFSVPGSSTEDEIKASWEDIAAGKGITAADIGKTKWLALPNDVAFDVTFVPLVPAVWENSTSGTAGGKTETNWDNRHTPVKYMWSESSGQNRSVAGLITSLIPNRINMQLVAVGGEAGSTWLSRTPLITAPAANGNGGGNYMYAFTRNSNGTLDCPARGKSVYDDTMQNYAYYPTYDGVCPYVYKGTDSSTSFDPASVDSYKFVPSSDILNRTPGEYNKEWSSDINNWSYSSEGDGTLQEGELDEHLKLTWDESYIKEWLNGEFYNKLPPFLKSAIKEVNKPYVVSRQNNEEYTSEVIDSSCHIWIPSLHEMYSDSVLNALWTNNNITWSGISGPKYVDALSNNTATILRDVSIETVKQNPYLARTTYGGSKQAMTTTRTRRVPVYSGSSDTPNTSDLLGGLVTFRIGFCL